MPSHYCNEQYFMHLLTVCYLWSPFGSLCSKAQAASLLWSDAVTVHSVEKMSAVDGWKLLLCFIWLLRDKSGRSTGVFALFCSVSTTLNYDNRSKHRALLIYFLIIVCEWICMYIYSVSGRRQREQWCVQCLETRNVRRNVI